MITERPVNAALKTMLVNNEPYLYAHLIKFERPSRPDSLSGLVSTSEERYTYLTDASINVDFNDGSVDLRGVANGTQTYLANKVLSVGAIQEQTKATTSTTTLVLDGNGLGADITGTATIATAGTDPVTGLALWNITYAAPISLDDLLAEGFREGDKVTVKGTSNLGLTGNGINVNITGFKANNVLTVSRIDESLTAATQSTQLKLASEEIISILLNKNSSEYSSFINREVFIYRGYFQNGGVVGEPTCIFKGIISGVGFEDSESSIKVSWNLSSHWSDFAQVKGRVTSDSSHRALDASGTPQPSSALKPIYAYDKGYIHAESSVNMLTKYVVQVEKQDVKSKKGVLGIGASVKVKKYMVPEDRFTNLDFQIQAKSIPVVYGVRKTEAIPIFADTLNTNSAEVYLAAVISEGEIGGIYDVFIDGNSLICNDKADYDARASQSSDNTVELLCRGRADNGDVLGGEQLIGTPYSYYGSSGEQISISMPDIMNMIASWNGYSYLDNLTIAAASSTGHGLVDGDSLRLEPPTSSQQITLDIFTGKSGQKASAQLSQIAFAKNFKIQNSYWKGNDTYEYWGPNHRLLDTAYVVGKFIIAEGDTSIPEINFIVRGKLIDCYNYDYSYLHDIKTTNESEADFILGQTVTLWRSDTNAQINTADTVQIIDKWTFYNPDKSINTRYRFNVIPGIYTLDASGEPTTGKPTVKKFYMKNLLGTKTWTMVTHNYNRLGAEYSDSANRVLVREPIVSQLSSITAPGGGYITFAYANNSLMTIEGDPTNNSALFQVTYLNGTSYDNISGTSTFPYAIMSGATNATALSFVSQYPSSTYGAEATSLIAKYSALSPLYLASKNTVRLPASASAVNDYYLGDIIEITRYNSTTGKSLVQTASIIGYNGGTNQIATIDGIWDFIPISTDAVRITPKYADSRVSINPAIQSLDYITSKTYGRGLDPYTDLYLPSWTESARKCDTQSDVTILITTGTPAVNDVYRYTNSVGAIIWQGRAISTYTVSGITGTFVTFDKVIGKLTNKWNSWKTFKEKEIVYNTSGSLFTVTTAGTFPLAQQNTWEASPSTAPAGMSVTSALTLSRDSLGTGSLSLAASLSYGNPVQGSKNGQKISGYSLYDCDDINYWKLSGWDEHSQRYATKNQSNIVIDTSVPLFDNMNGLLEHFNGILRYTAGKYYLSVEETEGTIATTNIRTITVDDIIGKIQLSDEGTRSAFNSLTAAFADPASKFEARNVSFFNSEYLKADRNVAKKGNLSIPGITNYYNTRLLADGFLNKSRYGLTISMTVRPSGFLLLAGTVIQVIYPRYDWVSPGKKFRIESITYQPDGLVDIVAKEYDDSFYSASNIKKSSGTGGTTVPTTSVPGSPTNLIITSADTADELLNGVELFWDNDPSINESSNAFTEIYASLSPHLYVTVTNISGTTLTTSSAHGLIPGMPIYPMSAYNTEINSEEIYYVLTAPFTATQADSTTFTLSSTKNGITPISLTTGSGLSLKIKTATLIGTVPVPIRSYVDSVVNDGTQRVEKYYWVRHRVNRT